jgi:hypothetical protein
MFACGPGSPTTPGRIFVRAVPVNDTLIARTARSVSLPCNIFGVISLAQPSRETCHTEPCLFRFSRLCLLNGTRDQQYRSNCGSLRRCHRRATRLCCRAATELLKYDNDTTRPDLPSVRLERLLTSNPVASEGYLPVSRISSNGRCNIIYKAAFKGGV